MKIVLVVLAMLCAGVSWAADKSAPPRSASIKGEVLEVIEVETYIYLRLKTKDGEAWAAVARAPVRKGADVTIENAVLMNNFSSKSLNRTFDKIAFGSLGGAGAGGDLSAAHSGVGKAAGVVDVRIPKAVGANARTVEEIVTRKAELKDKTVLVRGKVVKFTPDILGKNWIHLRDGSGSVSENTHDVLVTTKDQAKIGEVVVAKGVVHTDRDLGSGYSYRVLIEEATLQR